jgi:hypothetical protein
MTHSTDLFESREVASEGIPLRHLTRKAVCFLTGKLREDMLRR